MPKKQSILKRLKTRLVKKESDDELDDMLLDGDGKSEKKRNKEKDDKKDYGKGKKKKGKEVAGALNEIGA